MAVQKNFVVKNGLEVNGELKVDEALISADALVDKVGIGTDDYSSLSLLTVDGSISANGNLYLESGSGIGSIYNVKGTILQYEQGYINTGIVTNLTGTAVTYTTGNITNISGSGLAYTDAYINTGIVTNISGSDLNYTNGYINTGIVTNLNVTGVSTFQSDVNLGDNDRLRLGDDNDLQIFHNGSNSYIEDSGTGALIFKSNVYSFRNAADNEDIAKFTQNGAVELYYDNDKKFETTGYGVTVSGGLNVSGVSTFQDNVNIGVGGTTAFFDVNTGRLGISTNNPSQPLDVNGDARFRGALYDNNNIVGAANSILTSTGSGVVWADITTIPVGDANTLDGLDSTQFLRSDVADTKVGVTTFQDDIFLGGLNVSGVATFQGNIGVGTDVPNGAADPNNTTILNAGIVTANFYYGNGSNLIDISNLASDIDINTTGIITASTFYGDGSNLSGLAQQGIGIRTEGGDVGFGITFLDLRGAGVSTSYYSSGITTIFFEGGGSGTIGFGTEFPDNSEAGDLFYNAEYGRTFVYYDETIVGSGTSQFWVDASPFNEDSSNNNVFLPGSTSSPSWYIDGDSTTGVYSPSFGNLTFLSNGTEILNTNPSGIEVITGIATLNATEIETTTSVALKIDSDTNYNAIQINQLGGEAINFGGDDYAEFGNDFIIKSNGDTGIGTTNPTEKLDVLGTVKAVDFNSTSDVNLKENITTVDNALDLTNQLRGVRFEWKKDGKPSYGVIAQELETVLPELVTQSDPKTVNYNGIIGVLIEAVKELSAEVEQLKNK